MESCSLTPFFNSGLPKNGVNNILIYNDLQTYLSMVHNFVDHNFVNQSSITVQ